ncbi:MAG: hypothetical protein WDO69_29255 [Pseudomonadota bacterium]
MLLNALSPRLRQQLLAGIGLLLLLGGILFNLANAPRNGQDFSAFYYKAGARFTAGLSPYVFSGDPLRLHDAELGLAPPIAITGNGYPPLTSALMGLFVPLGETVGQYVFLLISLVIFCLGLWRFLPYALPSWSRAAHLFVVGATTFASSVRWSAGQYQLSLLALGLVCLAFDAELRQQTVAVILLTAFNLKITLILPIVGLLLLRRRIGVLVAAGALSIGLNLCCLSWTGFLESYAGWRINVANYIIVNGLNYPSVSTLVARIHGDPALAVIPPGIAMYDGFGYYYYPEGTHWVLLMSAFFTTLKAANWAAAILAAFFVLPLAWLGWRLRGDSNDRETLLRWFAVWTCFGLVCVTHLKYDLLMLIPVCFIALRFTLEQRKFADGALALTSFVTAYCLAARVATKWIYGVAIPSKQYWLIPIYSHLATLAFVFALWGLAVHALNRAQTRRMTVS